MSIILGDVTYESFHTIDSGIALLLLLLLNTLHLRKLFLTFDTIDLRPVIRFYLLIAMKVPVLPFIFLYKGLIWDKCEMVINLQLFCKLIDKFVEDDFGLAVLSLLFLDSHDAKSGLLSRNGATQRESFGCLSSLLD